MPANPQMQLPRLVLRVGFAGHRWDFDADAESALRHRVLELLAGLEQSMGAVALRGQGLYEVESPTLLRFVTGLAQGADLIAADQALASGWSLQLALPAEPEAFLAEAASQMSAEASSRYLEHARSLLKSASAVMSFDEPTANAAVRDGHELVCETVVAQSDVLIVVWDGQPARGFGGTAHAVRLAVDRGLPVVWIDARDGSHVRLMLPGREPTEGTDPLWKWIESSLLLDAQPDYRQFKPLRDSRQRWDEFLMEDATRSARFPPAFHLILCLGGAPWPRWIRRAKDSASAWLENWEGYVEALRQQDPAMADGVRDSLMAPFLRADHLAERFGRAYRGAYVLVYLLAGGATLVGLLGLIWLDQKPWFVATELMMILLMAVVAWVGRRNRWHDRWLEYRALAEQLRISRVTAWTADSTEPSDPHGDSVHPGASWVSWYLRACVRQLPMPAIRVNDQHSRLALDTISRRDIAPQHAFNRKTEKIQGHVHERLETIENTLLALLVLACVAYLCGNLLAPDWVEQHASKAMTLVGALIPALGAMVLGIRSQGEFGAYSARSADTAAELLPLIARTRRLLASPTRVRFEDLRLVCRGLVEALSNDTYAWRIVYRRKHLSMST